MKKFCFIFTLFLVFSLCLSAGAEEATEAESVGEDTTSTETIENDPSTGEIEGVTDTSAEAEAETSAETTVATDATASEDTSDDEAFDFGAYFEETIMPILSAVSAGILAVYVAVSPVLSRLRKSSDNFSDASVGIKEVVTDNDKRMQAVEALVNILKENVAKVVDTSNENQSEIKAEMEKLMESVKQTCEAFESIKEALKVALLNDESLVKKGYAVQIAKILKGELDDGRAEEDESQDEAGTV